MKGQWDVPCINGKKTCQIQHYLVKLLAGNDWKRHGDWPWATGLSDDDIREPRLIELIMMC